MVEQHKDRFDLYNNRTYQYQKSGQSRTMWQVVKHSLPGHHQNNGTATGQRNTTRFLRERETTTRSFVGVPLFRLCTVVPVVSVLLHAEQRDVKASTIA